MRIPTTIILLIGLALPTKIFAQDEILVDILPSKISTDISILIPNGQSYIFEKYHYFKYVYWVSFSDTLYKSDNGLLQGKRVSISPGNFSKKVNICDTTINKIRNLALDHKLLSDLLDVARREIGGDNQEFKINEGQPAERQAIDLCHTDFKTLIESWFNKKSIEIKTIKEEKIGRLEKIRLNQTVDKVFIKTFLEDCDFCEIDQIAILELIKNHPDDFLTNCKELSDTEFFNIKLNLLHLPDSLATNEAMEKLNNSPVRTNRKGKLIRQLKKNAR
jgi:hypothetical protein